MDIHKPKPVHGWRGFLSEIGTIVIGILIALSLEQAVEWVHWRDQVSEAKGVIAAELTRNLVPAYEQVHLSFCVERRLDTLAQILDAASRTGKLPPIGDIGNPLIRPWPTAAWESVIASQTASHFSREQVTRMARLYRLVSMSADINQKELEAWSDLNAMVGPGRGLDPVSEAALRAALGRARFYGREMALFGQRIIEGMDGIDIPFGRDDIRTIEDARKNLPAMQICGKLAAPKFANYGQAPLSARLPMVKDALKRPLNLPVAN